MSVFILEPNAGHFSGSVFIHPCHFHQIPYKRGLGLIFLERADKMPQPEGRLLLVLFFREQRIERKRLPGDELRQSRYRGVTRDSLSISDAILRGVRIKEFNNLLRSHTLPELQFIGKPSQLLKRKGRDLTCRQTVNSYIVDCLPDTEPLESRRRARSTLASYPLDSLPIVTVDFLFLEGDEMA